MLEIRVKLLVRFRERIEIIDMRGVGHARLVSFVIAVV